MNESTIEECPVCWRSYSSSVVPVSITCGHSFCEECSDGLRNCPLCRVTLKKGYSRTKNYSLLSLVNKIEQDKKEMKEQESQTDIPVARQLKPKPILRGTAAELNTLITLRIMSKITNIQNILGKCLVTNSKVKPN